MIRVLLVTGSPVVAAGLATILDEDPGIWIVGSVAWPSQDPRPDLLPLGEADVILWETDLAPVAHRGPEPTSPNPTPDRASLPSLGSELDSDLPLPSGASDAAAVVLLTDDPGAARSSLARGGLLAILPRSASAEEILAAVRATAAGLAVLPPDVARFGPDRDSARPDRGDPLPRPLTPRETEVLDLLAEGLGNKTIARRLGISEHTVKAHVAAIFDKLDVSTRTEAVAVGIRRGLVLL